MRKKATVFASISGCIAVIMGALGAHGLSHQVEIGKISTESLHAFETAAHYQLLHSIAIIAIVALQYKFAMYFKPIIYLMMSGIILFCGSIYLLVLCDWLKSDFKNIIGPITPLGGLCFIVAWFALFLSALKYKDKDIPPTNPQ